MINKLYDFIEFCTDFDTTFHDCHPSASTTSLEVIYLQIAKSVCHNADRETRYAIYTP